MINSQQLLFDFSDVEELVVAPKVSVECKEEAIVEGDIKISKHFLNLAVIKWLEQMEEAPQMLAINVPTRIKKFKSDIACAWSMAQRKGGARILLPERTMIIECRNSIEECSTEIGRSSQMIESINDLVQEMEVLKEQIMQEEPHLKTEGALFDEFAEWDFDKSDNYRYRQLTTKVSEIKQALYSGTYFECLHRARLADQMYLAVPAGMVMPEHVAGGWGLLWVHPNLEIEEKLAPIVQLCHSSKRLHLVQNIANSAKRAVLFSMGVQKTSMGVNLLKKPSIKRSRIVL
ncbi:MAG: hypothetical protein ACRC37_03180 [Lentisphaeria bacterium]